MISSSLIIHILIAFGAFQALFISSVFLAQKNSRFAQKLFALFLIIEGITLVERLLAETGLIEAVPHLLGISYPISFIKPPVLLFMAWAIVNPKFKLRKIHSLHFLPFFIMLVINIPFYSMDAAYKLEVVEAFFEHVPSYTSFYFYLSLSFYFNIGIYVIAAMTALKGYKKHVKNNKLANWYFTVLGLYGTALFLGLIYFVLRPSGILVIPEFNIISMLSMTFLVQSIAYRFFIGADVFNSKNAPVLGNIDQRMDDEKRIREKLEREKVFLNDELTLADFASSLDLSKKYVSDIINQRFGNSFKELINLYRVREAKAIMKKEVHRKRQLIEIAQESGFNNKVSFYRAFKKHGGQSPSDYFQSLTKTAHHE